MVDSLQIGACASGEDLGNGFIARSIKDRVDLLVGGETRGEFGADPGENVDHAGRDVADRQHFGKGDRAECLLFRGDRYHGVAGHEWSGDQGDQTEEGRRIGANHACDAARLRGRHIPMRRGHRIDRAEDGAEFVRPASVVDEAIDGEIYLACGGLGIVTGERQFRKKGGPAAFEDFCGTVEDLAAEESGRGLPGRLSGTGDADGVAQVLAGGVAVIGHVISVWGSRNEVATAFRTGERSADEQFVGLCHREAWGTGRHEATFIGSGGS